MDFLFQIVEYCLVFITVSAKATLRSHSKLPESSLALFIVCFPVLNPCLLSRFVWSVPVLDLPFAELFRTVFAPRLDYFLFVDSPYASPSGLRSASTDSRLSLDYSFVLPVLNLLLLLSTQACFMTTPLNKGLHMDPHVYSVHFVTVIIFHNITVLLALVSIRDLKQLYWHQTFE